MNLFLGLFILNEDDTATVPQRINHLQENWIKKGIRKYESKEINNGREEICI